MIDQGIVKPGTGNGQDRSGKCRTQYVMGSMGQPILNRHQQIKSSTLAIGRKMHYDH